MNKIIFSVILLFSFLSLKPKNSKIIARQGQVSFFSYTTAENIEAKNNQVLSIIDFSTNEIAVSMLMNAFVFKKSLMQNHFNDSYIESDLYPKATFKGEIIDFDPTLKGMQTRVIKGTLTMRNIPREVIIKANIQNKNETYIVTGEFELTVQDFKINIPLIVAPNIAEIITTKFRFEYEPYEK